MYRAVCALLLTPLAFILCSPAQSVSFGRHVYPNTPFIYGHADLNNDGREDLITPCGSGLGGDGSGRFAVSLSTGNGTYAPQACYSLPTGPGVGVLVGDFNSDGNLDLMANNGTNFYEFLNDGAGNFRLARTIAAPQQIVVSVTDDANHDGLIDLIWTGVSDQKLNVWFGNPDGSFTVGPTSPLNVQGSLIIGDFDGDGNADVLSQFNTYGNVIQVAYGDGHGHFQAQPSFGDDAVFEAYDLNGDGAMDLVGHPFDFSLNGSTYYKTARAWYGHSNRTFTKQDIPLTQCDAGAFPPAVADVDGDGVNDLVVEEASDCQGSAPYTLAVKLGRGDGTYQPEQPFYSTDALLTTLAPVRINTDSKPDFLLFAEVQGASDTELALFNDSTPGNFPKCAPPLRGTGFNLCSPTKTVSGSASVKFSLSAANQTRGRKMEVWVDGKKMAENLKQTFSYYSFLDTTLTLSPGTHRVDIYSAGWDNLLQSYMWTGGPGFSIPLTVKSSTCPVATGLTICSPLNEATVASPVRAWASGSFSGTKTQRMEVWVDGEKRFSTFGANTLDTKISLAAGVHQFTYYLVGADGSITHSTVVATVR